MSYWKIYRIAKMIIGRKRMRRLMMTALTILVIGACYCGSHPGTYEKVSGIYQEQKTNINSAVRNLTKSALTDAANRRKIVSPGIFFGRFLFFYTYVHINKPLITSIAIYS